MRKQILKIYGAILGAGFLYLLLMKVTGFQLNCAFRSRTGLLCPGCGGSRMFLSLFRLEIGEAFRYNPFLFLCLILWNAVAALCFWGKPTYIRSPRFLYALFAATMTAAGIYWIARNIC